MVNKSGLGSQDSVTLANYKYQILLREISDIIEAVTRAR